MEKKWSDMIDKRMRHYLLWTAAGMVLGYLYYSLVGCASGTCPIFSSPFLTILYGGAMGWISSGIFEPEADSKPEREMAAVRVRARHEAEK